MTALGSGAGSPAGGRIITFYSYKGGTGRSMALANVAWILASQNKRVLVVDWDFEAPGLHRYFHPFLEDAELSASPGLIDYFYDVVGAARAAATAQPAPSEGESPWWHAWTSWLRYTYPLDTGVLAGAVGASSPNSPAPPTGSIDFVPAGRQGPDYADRVGGFDWKSFYERLGGGVLLEAVKQRLRERYDYVLIDSRTGISDTSGICTVQMPDDLVVCFTLNRQSLLGAAAAAKSAAGQRTKPDGIGGLRIWPVPMRVELAERDRLEAARTWCQNLFWEHLGPLLKSRSERPVYWGQVEVLYQPYFAYEEVLAVFAERRHQTGSLLASFEYLCGFLSDGVVQQLGQFDEGKRGDILRRYVPKHRPSGSMKSAGIVYISYRSTNADAMRKINEALHDRGIATWVDVQDILLGSRIKDAIAEGLAGSSLVLVLVDRKGVSPNQLNELEIALQHSKRVIPVLIENAEFGDLPLEMAELQALQLRTGEDLTALVESVRRVLEHVETQQSLRVDVADPQKSAWGGKPSARGRTLSAQVKEVPGTLYSEIKLSVAGSSGVEPLSGDVVFHLHPTFLRPVRQVPVVDGVAELRMMAWGAFTVGVEADAGKTRLELDLSQDPSFPAGFRAR